MSFAWLNLVGANLNFDEIHILLWGGAIEESCLIKADSLLCRHNVVISNARYLFICAFCLFFLDCFARIYDSPRNDRKRVQIRT